MSLSVTQSNNYALRPIVQPESGALSPDLQMGIDPPILQLRRPWQQGAVLKQFCDWYTILRRVWAPPGTPSLCRPTNFTLAVKRHIFVGEMLTKHCTALHVFFASS